MQKFRQIINRKYNFKIGLVGCGNIAHYQVKYIMQLVQKKSIAISDMDKIRMQCLGQRFGISNMYGTSEELLHEFQPHIVHILTPPKTHFGIARDCLANRSHIFLEKPLCMSVKEAETLYALAQEQERLVCVDHLLPFDPLLIEAKEDILAKGLGRIKKVLIRDERSYFAKKNLTGVSSWLKELPGELHFDIMPHHFSIVNFLLGNCTVEKADTHQIEEGVDKVWCSLKSIAGSAEIAVNIHSPKPAFDIIILCESGYVMIDFLKRSKMIDKGQFPLSDPWVGGTLKFNECKIKETKIRKIIKKLMAQDGYIGMQKLITKFYESVALGQDSPISEEEGLRVTRQLDNVFGRIGRSTSSSRDEIIGANLQIKGRPSNQKSPRILVTGATGFIGRILVDRLKHHGHEVRVLVRCKYENDPEWENFWNGLDIYVGDVADLEIVEKACSGIDLVYHLAAATGGEWAPYIDSTVKGTDNIMKAALRAGCKKMVYVSSIALLDQSKYPRQGPIDEHFPYEKYPGRRDAYCLTKLWAERMVNTYAKEANNFKIVTLRPGIVYGPGKIPFENFGRKIGNFIVIKGDGNRLLPLVYVENLIDSLLLAARTQSSGVYNVVDSENVTIRQFFRCYQKIAGTNFRTLFLPINVLLGYQAAIQILRRMMGKQDNYAIYKLRCIKRGAKHSTRKLQSELGWSQRITFEEGMLHAVNHRYETLA